MGHGYDSKTTATGPSVGPGVHTTGPGTSSVAGGSLAKTTRDLVPMSGAPNTPSATASTPIIAAGAATKPEVAATAVGAAADTEYAFDDSFTPALVAALKANPKVSLDEVLEQLAAGSLGTGVDNSHGLHHPTIVQYGQTVRPPGDATPQKKAAVLIANQHYTNINPLGTPIAEAGTMQSELASRGFDANVHSDKSAADMGTLWSTMVGAANHGDDLVAFYGGHGAPEGLVGIDHATKVPDIFSNGQVASVVGSATDRGAHIRFIMDSCHSGAAVQAVREVRQNALAEVATTTGDQLRTVAMTGLGQAKQRLIAHCNEGTKTLRDLDRAIAQHHAQPPDPADDAATAKTRDVAISLVAAKPKMQAKLDAEADRIWADYVPLLEIVKTAVHHPEAPPAITDYRTLGAQINYLDDLSNTVSQPMERKLGDGAAAATKAP